MLSGSAPRHEQLLLVLIYLPPDSLSEIFSGYAMVSSQTNSLVVGAVGLGLVGISSVPAFLRLYTRSFPRKGSDYDEIHKLYEDGDGTATEESEKTYSAVIPRYLILFSAVIGVLLSIAAAVLSAVHPGGPLSIENWLTFGSWVRHNIVTWPIWN